MILSIFSKSFYTRRSIFALRGEDYPIFSLQVRKQYQQQSVSTTVTIIIIQHKFHSRQQMAENESVKVLENTKLKQRHSWNTDIYIPGTRKLRKRSSRYDIPHDVDVPDGAQPTETYRPVTDDTLSPSKISDVSPSSVERTNENYRRYTHEGVRSPETGIHSPDEAGENFRRKAHTHEGVRSPKPELQLSKFSFSFDEWDAQRATEEQDTNAYTAEPGKEKTETADNADPALLSSDDNTSGLLSAPPEILARGPRAKRAYAEAARDGTKKVYRTRLMLVGQERVGKTSLKKSLTGQRFDENEAITDGVETTSGCDISIELAKAGGKWCIHQKKGTTDEANEDSYKQALADAIAKQLIIGSLEKDQPESQGPDTTDGIGLNPSEMESLVGPSPSSGAASPSIEPSMPQQIASLVERMLKEQVRLKQCGAVGGAVGGANPDSSSAGEVSLSIWDFAGHDVYYTTHQAKQNSKSELTCLQFITFWLNSIFAHAVAPSSVTKNSTCKTHQKSPPIFIVGTHKQSLSGDAKAREKKVEAAFKDIRKTIQKKPYENHVVPRYYAVDNSLGEDDKEIVALREHIERVAKEEPYMGENMPIKYLLFEEALAVNKINFLSLDQVKDMMRKVGTYSDQELVTMLHFYHDLGFIVYFGEVETEDEEEEESHLRDIVILNPQWLIDVFKQVITVLEPAKRDGIVSDAWTKLEQDGVLEERLIHHMWEGFLEQKGALVQLMAKFDLICEAPPLKPESTMSDGEETMEDRPVMKQYYVPSRLTPSCSREDIGQIDKKSSLEFYVDFRGFLPDGLFHRLMTRTVRWIDDEGGEPVLLFYRQISLMPDDVHQVLLEMLPPHEAAIKIIVFRADIADPEDDAGVSHVTDPPKPDVVKRVMTFLTDTLASIRRQMAKRIQYDVCFACPKCGKKKTFKEGSKKRSLRCGMHVIPVASVWSKFGMEHSGAVVGSESPLVCRKKKDVLCEMYFSDLAEKIGSEWKTLALKLGLKKADLDHITEEHHVPVDRIFTVLHTWRERASCSNKKERIAELCKGLCDCGRTDLSDRVKEDAGIS
ncbi:uncharacterized protein [Diadema antillarum]|uniref:uncharacterized protein isoform X2 n=1 Tax=Diadema antillarum TaxID=105358 RepID=UPI003A84AF22